MNNNDNAAGCAGRLENLIQSLSSTLKNIDLEHKRDLERLSVSTLEGDFAAVIMATLEKRHWQRREPYVRHLEELRERARQEALVTEWNDRSAMLAVAE